jgi:hypothetical protein
MLPFGMTIPATVPQGSEIPEGLMNNPVYRTAKGSISFTEIRKASRKDRSGIQHHRIYIETWTENRTNIYQLGRKATVIEKKERDVNKTDEKELCDDNTPDDTDAFQADVCSV